MLLGQRSSRRFRIWWLQAFAPSSLWPPPARHYLSRRISKSSAGVITHYLYDGWNLIAEYTGTVLEKTYTWGMDLSGSMQGTGGVGGLLAVSEFTTQNSQVTIQNYYPTYDGNGNVSEYLDSAGLVVAHFEYDPFGNTTVNTDTAGLFDILFSTKKRDLATGLYYYGYRYYDPVTGRWPSRDPLADEAFFEEIFRGMSSKHKKAADEFSNSSKSVRRSNQFSKVAENFMKRVEYRRESRKPLYGFCENNGISNVDYRGLLILPSEMLKLACKCCASAVGANVLASLKVDGIDGNDDAGGGNAYRHCLASCRTSKGCTAICSKSFWDGRENPNNASGQQDLANNKNGRDVASGGGGG